MEKPHSALRKTSHFLRKQHPSKVIQEVEEPKAKVQRTATKDKYCQTEDHHDGCCEPAVGTGGSDPGPNTAVLSMEPGDPPLLQQQLQTSKSGIQQIIECFRSGTAQLKHMLLKEVDTIFECKLCRSLFRGLPNLITHKEFYCFPRDPDPADPPAEDKQSQAIKDLLEAIYPRKDRPEYVVRLEPIESNQNAVFQYLSEEDEVGEQEEQAPPSEPAPEEPKPDEPPADAPEEEEESTPAQEEVPEAAPEQEAEPEAEEEEGEKPAELWAPVEETVTSDEEEFKISCCLCGKDFNSHRSVRRHCRKMHKKKMDELRKFTETRTVPISLFSMVKDPPPLVGPELPHVLQVLRHQGQRAPALRRGAPRPVPGNHHPRHRHQARPTAVAAALALGLPPQAEAPPPDPVQPGGLQVLDMQEEVQLAGN
ncbi:hypothetical protein AAFF_G00151260, partial [Aldrovandia affinis]